MGTLNGLTKWHEFVENKDLAKLDEFIDENATLYSPVVWTPVKGKKMVYLYLIAAGEIIANKNFKYVRELTNENEAVLEFSTEIDGIIVEGVDMIVFTKEGKLKEIKVLIRPLQAVHKVHEKMGEYLLKMKKKQ